MSSLVMVKQWDKILAEVLPQTLSALFFKEPVFSHIAPLPLLSLTLASHLASELLQELASCLLLPFLPSVCSQHCSQSHPSASSQQPPAPATPLLRITHWLPSHSGPKTVVLTTTGSAFSLPHLILVSSLSFPLQPQWPPW